MKKYFVRWLEEYLFFPTPLQSLIGILLLPFTVIYCVITAYNRISKKPIEFGIPVISIGNLVLGGTGKTPVIIALAKKYQNSAVVLRGYGRKTQGLLVVSDGKKILEDVNSAGDEAILLASALPHTVIIVCEDRKYGVLKAKEMGCNLVFLDDGYRHHDIKKLDILLRPKKEPTNIFCLPSGGYRDTKMMYSFADIVLKEEEDFHRIVTFSKEGKEVLELPQNTVLLTAISKAERLFEYLPKNTPSVIFEDHYFFTKQDIERLYVKYPNCNIITTQKDYVKLQTLHLKNIYLMNLEVNIKEDALEKIDSYIQNYFLEKKEN